MSEGGGAERSAIPQEGGRAFAKARAAFALLALGLSLGGCGNCGGWSNPWSRVAPANSCQSDHPSGQAMLPLLSQFLGE